MYRKEKHMNISIYQQPSSRSVTKTPLLKMQILPDNQNKFLEYRVQLPYDGEVMLPRIGIFPINELTEFCMKGEDSAYRFSNIRFHFSTPDGEETVDSGILALIQEHMMTQNHYSWGIQEIYHVSQYWTVWCSDILKTVFFANIKDAALYFAENPKRRVLSRNMTTGGHALNSGTKIIPNLVCSYSDADKYLKASRWMTAEEFDAIKQCVGNNIPIHDEVSKISPDDIDDIQQEIFKVFKDIEDHIDTSLLSPGKFSVRLMPNIGNGNKLKAWFEVGRLSHIPDFYHQFVSRDGCFRLRLPVAFDQFSREELREKTLCLLDDLWIWMGIEDSEIY